MIADKACYERGCACYDSRDGDGVEVMRKEWVGLTDEEIRAEEFDHVRRRDFARAIESKLKEKNT